MSLSGGLKSKRYVSGLVIVVTAMWGCVATAEAQPSGSELRVDPERIHSRILALSEFGRNPDGGVSRVAFSQADVEGRSYVMALMGEAGLEVSIDPAGNILGRRAGSDPSLPAILFGSHIDSVPFGGNYDGDVGVIAAIECAQVLEENSVTTRHPLEVVVFSDEEGGLTGSRALIGELGDQALRETTHSGLTRQEGIRAIGGDPDRIPEARRAAGEIAAYLELHIEQGARLDEDEIDIGVVEGIVGIEWWDVTIDGVANHAGTTPMDRRSDALLAAARYIQAVNEIVTAEPGRQVGTVGRIAAEPGAHNVIPGRVRTTLEIRDLSREKIWALFDRIQERSRSIAEETGTTFTFTLLDVSSVPAVMDERVRGLIAVAADRLELSWVSMPSGAGHDAQDVARIAPAGMIFVPSEGGVSHSPAELTTKGDMANGADVLLQTLLEIDRGGLD
jgi:N-carbamoyl-L-amino-acid hydrolase